MGARSFVWLAMIDVGVCPYSVADFCWGNETNQIRLLAMVREEYFKPLTKLKTLHIVKKKLRAQGTDRYYTYSTTLRAQD